MNESSFIRVEYWSKMNGSVLCWLIYVYCKDTISLKKLISEVLHKLINRLKSLNDLVNQLIGGTMKLVTV